MKTKDKFQNKTQLVKKHLQSKKKITSWEAIQLYRATRLSSIIFNLKESGMNIVSKEIRDGRNWYVEYRLK